MQSSLAATVEDNFIFIFTVSVFCLFGDLWKWEYRQKHKRVKYKPKRHAQDKTTFSIIKLFHFNISSTVKKKKSLFKTQWLNLPQGYSKLDSNKLYYFEFLKWSKPLNTKKKRSAAAWFSSRSIKHEKLFFIVFLPSRLAQENKSNLSSKHILIHNLY